jgi:hypothetical protein
MRIRDPGWKKFGSGIRDKHPGSATLGLTALPCRSLVEEKAASSQATAHRLHTVSSTTMASLGTVLSHHNSASSSLGAF